MPTFRDDIKLGSKVPMTKTDDINDQAITNEKLGDQSVDGRVLREENVETKHLANESVTTDKVATKSITEDKLADKSVNTEQVKNGSITTSKLADASVSTEKIASRSVTNDKIALNSISRAELSSSVRASIDAKANTEDVNNSLYNLKKELGNRVVVEGDVVNLPDDEDLVSVEESNQKVLKFADKPYLPQLFSGKGHVILRKNIQKVSIPVITITVNSIPSADGNLTFVIDGITTNISVSKDVESTVDLIAQKIASKLQITMPVYTVISSGMLVTLTSKYSGNLYSTSSFSANSTGVNCNIVEQYQEVYRNILTSSMLSATNTIYEVRYDFDLNRAKLFKDNSNSYIEYAGGKLCNGSIQVTNSFGVDFRLFGDNITLLGYEYNITKTHANLSDSYIRILLDDLPGVLSKYNIVEGEGVYDNAEKINKLVNDSIFKKIICSYKSVSIVFSRKKEPYIFYNSIYMLYYLDCGITTRLVINNDLIYDCKNLISPSLDEVNSPNYKAKDFTFIHTDAVHICGNYTKNKKIRLITISTRNIGHLIYYEGVGDYIYSSFSLAPFNLSNTCLSISNISIDSFYHGLGTSANIIKNVIVSNIFGDNGITISKNSYLPNLASKVINCYVSHCIDLGISSQTQLCIIENCVIEDCGNSKDMTDSNFGVNGSFNAGGGISIEPKIVNLPYSKCTINNCIIRNCYNYAIGTDISDNIIVTNTLIENIISSYNEKFKKLEGFKYQSKNIRQGGIIYTNSDVNNYLNILIKDCVIKDSNVGLALNCKKGIPTFKGCTISGITCETPSVQGNRKCIVKDSILKEVSFVSDYILERGTSAQRPILTSTNEGFEYYDSTLKKKILWNGSDWVNLDGTSL